METKEFSVASKSQLAKLLATENLVIQHQKMTTAKFDPVNRVLYCPIWTDMTGSLYDLLLGHEVGHALYTPADGWHDAACSQGGNYKHFLNVVEDARIEKKIKKRYPGIRRSFVDGYANLNARDFFGIRNKDLNTLPFIDRLNLFTKSSYTMDIQFNDYEQTLLEKVKNLETWTEVVDVTNEIWKYSKDEQSQMVMDEIVMGNFAMHDDDDDEYDEYDLDSKVSDELESNNSKSSDSQERDISQEDEDIDEDIEQPEGINRYKNSELSTGDQHDLESFEPSCMTDEVYRSQEYTLVDKKCRSFVYIDMPEPILENIVTPRARVQEILTEYYVNRRAESYRTNILNQFKRKNDRYVSLLVKEFEMKKAAAQFSKSKTASTGDLDISKLYKYMVDDNIFRKSMRVPKGKSHGLVLLLDKSGSMSDNLKGSIEQILILASFCRKVNIPFVVYGFGNSEEAYYHDNNSRTHDQEFFKTHIGAVEMRHVMMREYLNSKMSNSEFTTACKNMLCLGETYDRKFGKCGQYPRSEDLSNTPLNEALVACAKITTNFRKENGLDIVNLVIINDGDADYVGSYNCGDIGYKYFDPRQNNVILQDRKIKFQCDVSDSNDLQSAIMKWFTAKTDAKIFGFYITNNGVRGIRDALRRQYYENGTTILDACKGNITEYQVRINKVVNIVKKNKFINSNKPGYESFFLIPGGSDLQVEDEQIEIDTTKKITNTRLAAAFRRYNEKRQLNRVLVSQFIEGIAK